jgi:hypothetical protein
MSFTTSKPRLVFFTPGEKFRDILAPNCFEPIVERVNVWLDHYFEVITISENCDYKKVIEQHKPDYCLFDGLIESLARLRLAISNLDSYPEIPRAGLCRIDAISPSRGICWEEFDRFGVEALFTLGDLCMGESYQEIADKVFYVPWFINPSVYKDYNEPKSIPVVMFGNFDSKPCCYPWRASVREPLLQNLPALYYRHPGYSKQEQKSNSLVLYGESFARALNASYVSPSSGGFTNIVISKQIEIPACNSLLITNDVEAVKLYGFKNFENCLFADQDDIVHVIERVLNDKKLYNNICSAGFEFAHSKHTHMQRPQLLQWFMLRKNLQKGYKIIQPDIFGPLKAVPEAYPEQTYHIQCNDVYKILHKVDECIKEKKYTEADFLIDKMIGFCSYMSEPKVRRIIIQLLTKKAKDAALYFGELLDFKTSMGGMAFDPLEWALFLVTLGLSGYYKELNEYILVDSDSERAELDTVRWAFLSMLNRTQESEQFFYRIILGRNDKHTSIHNYPKHSPLEILRQLQSLYQFYDKQSEVQALNQLIEHYQKAQSALAAAGQLSIPTQQSNPA